METTPHEEDPTASRTLADYRAAMKQHGIDIGFSGREAERTPQQAEAAQDAGKGPQDELLNGRTSGKAASKDGSLGL